MVKEITSLLLFPEHNWCWHGAKVSRVVGSRWTWVFKNTGRLRGVSVTRWKSYFTDLWVYSRLEPPSLCTSFLDNGGVFVDLFWRWPEQDLPWFLEDFSSAWKSLASKYMCVCGTVNFDTQVASNQIILGLVRPRHGTVGGTYGCEWGETWMRRFLWG